MANYFFVPGMCDIRREDFGKWDIAVEIVCHNGLDNRWAIVTFDVMDDEDKRNDLIQDFKRHHRRAIVERVNMYSAKEYFMIWGGDDEEE